MYDWIESMENAAENRYFDMLQPNGKLKCDCGEIFEADAGNTLSSNPYATPVCPKCLEKYSKEYDKQKSSKELEKSKP